MDTNLTKSGLGNAPDGNKEEPRVEKVASRPTVTPRVDIYENSDELLLLADLPGVNEDRLKVHIDNDRLTIDGAVGPELGSSLLAREWRAFDYTRTFVLPVGVDATKISADLKDGVLRLHLPKADAARPRRIEVKAG